MTLANLPRRTTAHVCSVRADAPAARRLSEMGVVPGVAIELTGRAPLGGAVRVRLGGHQIALRSEEADLIQIRLGVTLSGAPPLDLSESGAFAIGR